MKVVLTSTEMMTGAITGALRNVESVKRGLLPAHGYDDKTAWSVHIEGACGEIAAARALGLYWSATVNTFGKPDIEPNIQVRTRSRHDYDLIVRQNDNEDDIYVLVTGVAPEFWVRGWIKGSEAKRQDYWMAHGGRPAAWFVPADQLRDPSSYHSSKLAA